MSRKIFVWMCVKKTVGVPRVTPDRKQEEKRRKDEKILLINEINISKIVDNVINA